MTADREHLLTGETERPPLYPRGMTPETCTINGCVKAGGRHGWCRAHEARWIRHGYTGPVEVGYAKQPPTCSENDCGATTVGSGRGMCKKHYTRYIRSDEYKPIAHLGVHGSAMWNWTGQDANYFTVHARLRTERGPARRCVCVDCGRPAREWSYDHADPNERQSECGPYSLNPEHYQARCMACHDHLDYTRHPFEHGTLAGYHRHLKHKEEPVCDPCRQASNSLAAGYRAARAAAKIPAQVVFIKAADRAHRKGSGVVHVADQRNLYPLCKSRQTSVQTSGPATCQICCQIVNKAAQAGVKL